MYRRCASTLVVAGSSTIPDGSYENERIYNNNNNNNKMHQIKDGSLKCRGIWERERDEGKENKYLRGIQNIRVLLVRKSSDGGIQTRRGASWVKAHKSSCHSRHVLLVAWFCDSIYFHICATKNREDMMTTYLIYYSLEFSTYLVITYLVLLDII